MGVGGAHITRLGSAGSRHVLCQRSSDNEIDTGEQELKAIRRKLEKIQYGSCNLAIAHAAETTAAAPPMSPRINFIP